jgi:hypothetical protein
MKKHNLSNLLEKALHNIESDRKETEELLLDIKSYLAGSQERYTEVGSIAAKFVETLQRSNEQLVKIASLVQKKEATDTSENLTDGDRDSLFDLIQEVK